MHTIDLTPLYRSSVGFDRFQHLLDSALRTDNSACGYPPYNIKVLAENEYEITLAVAGFSEEDLDIQVESNVLSIRGNNDKQDESANFLHKGIANRSFERKFNLADYVEVKGANLQNGLLSVELVREIPDAAKPRKINIGKASNLFKKVSKNAA